MVHIGALERAAMELDLVSPAVAAEYYSEPWRYLGTDASDTFTA